MKLLAQVIKKGLDEKEYSKISNKAADVIIEFDAEDVELVLKTSSDEKETLALLHAFQQFKNKTKEYIKGEFKEILKKYNCTCEEALFLMEQNIKYNIPYPEIKTPADDFKIDYFKEKLLKVIERKGLNTDLNKLSNTKMYFAVLNELFNKINPEKPVKLEDITEAKTNKVRQIFIDSVLSCFKKVIQDNKEEEKETEDLCEKYKDNKNIKIEKNIGGAEFSRDYKLPKPLRKDKDWDTVMDSFYEYHDIDFKYLFLAQATPQIDLYRKKDQFTLDIFKIFDKNTMHLMIDDGLSLEKICEEYNLKRSDYSPSLVEFSCGEPITYYNEQTIFEDFGEVNEETIQKAQEIFRKEVKRLSIAFRLIEERSDLGIDVKGLNLYDLTIKADGKLQSYKYLLAEEVEEIIEKYKEKEERSNNNEEPEL